MPPNDIKISKSQKKILAPPPKSWGRPCPNAKLNGLILLAMSRRRYNHILLHSNNWSALLAI